MEILNIQTTRLNVRHLKLSDLIDFQIYRSNPKVTNYQGFDVMTIEQAEEFKGKVSFPEKLKKANEILTKASLPKVAIKK